MIFRSLFSGKALLSAFLFFATVIFTPPTLIANNYIPCEGYPGECYAQSRRSCQLAAGVALGVLLFAGMVAVVIQDGTSSHHH